MKPPSEKELWRILDTSETAFTSYITTRIRAIKRHVSSADIWQLVLTHAVAGREGLRDNSEPIVRAWIKAICLHRIQDALRFFGRRQRRVKMCSIEYITTTAANMIGVMHPMRSPSSTAAAGEARQALYEAIAALAGERQKALKLRYMQGWSLDQIAIHLNKSKSSVRSTIYRALCELKRNTRLNLASTGEHNGRDVA